MGVGGATWDTAGTLDPSGVGDNLFDVADAAAAGDTAPFYPGWWTITGATRRHVYVTGYVQVGDFSVPLSVRVYRGPDEDTAELIGYTNTLFAPVNFTVEPGVVYHVAIGVAVEEYGALVTTFGAVAVVELGAAVTPWSTTFQDQEANRLVVGTGNLVAEENPDGFDEGFYWFSWFRGVDATFPGVIDYIRGRRGSYLIQEVAGGEDPIDAGDCAWEHAAWGEQDFQSWNTTTTGAGNPGPPSICRVILKPDPPGDAEVGSFNSGASRKLDYLPGATLISASMTAEETMSARGLWFGQALPGLMESQDWQRGTLPMTLADPLADGIPIDYTGSFYLEWEGDLELVKVEVTGDRDDRDEDVDHGVTLHFNDKILPGYHPAGSGSPAGDWDDAWKLGVLGVEDPLDEVAGRPYLEVEYANGAADWVEYPGIESWDDCQPVDGSPDARVGIRMTDEPNVDEEFSLDADVAVRYTFRAPRYRWVYFPTITAIPPRRIFQRSDGATRGARRVIGGGNTRQSGGRTIGAIL